jgi:hypothetical protein
MKNVTQWNKRRKLVQPHAIAADCENSAIMCVQNFQIKKFGAKSAQPTAANDQ